MERHGRYVITIEFYGIQVECHGIQKIGTRTKLVSGSKQWKYMEFAQQNGCQQ